MKVTINSQSGVFSSTSPEMLFKNNFIAPNAGHQKVYDISTDNQRFLMIQHTSQHRP